MSDIRLRLRNLGKSLQGYDNAKADLLIEAAKEIGRLRREVKKRKALQAALPIQVIRDNLDQKMPRITDEEIARRLGGVLKGVVK